MVNPHDITWWVRRKPVRYLNVDEFPPLPDNFKIDPSESELIQWCRERTEYGEENLYTKDWDADQWRAYLNTYYRLVERADHEIGRMLRTARYKYVAYRGRQPSEMLFDMETDPGETKNMVHDSTSRQTLAHHRRLLCKWTEKMNDNFQSWKIGI